MTFSDVVVNFSVLQKAKKKKIIPKEHTAESVCYSRDSLSEKLLLLTKHSVCGSVRLYICQAI